MNRRKNLIAAALVMLGLVALLVPLAQLLTYTLGAADDSGEQAGRMYAMLAEYEAAKPDVPVEPMMDIEDAWAIEDTRTEAEGGLVTAMLNGGQPLGYDAGSQTFYCTLGMDGGDDWPELALLAGGADGLRAAFIDDYTYDFRSDAIREGYRYELLAYTDTEYAYFGVVFTGLPIVTLHVDEGTEIGDEYVPARTSVSAAGYEPICTTSQVHLRGGGFFKGIDKKNYRVEFHELSSKGRDKKADISVLGMEADSDWLLVGNAGDESCIRNALCWQMWDMWNRDREVFTRLESHMVEVFVQDEYVGLYQLMPRIRADEELVRMGGSLETDSVTRLIGARTGTGKPILERHDLIDGNFELRYAPGHMSDSEAFALFEDYVTLSLPQGKDGRLDDEAFAALALERMDVYDLMSYYLFVQACSLPLDNVKNNVYIWAMRDGDRYTYMLSPWDMDSGLQALFTDDTPSYNFWMVLPDRMLDLNVGNCRETLWDIWYEKRTLVVSDDSVYQWIHNMEEMINASGAYLRETERWRGGAQELNMAGVSAYMVSHMNEIEFQLSEIWPAE